MRISYDQIRPPSVEHRDSDDMLSGESEEDEEEDEEDQSSHFRAAQSKVKNDSPSAKISK